MQSAKCKKEKGLSARADLDEIKSLVSRCVKCGRCRSVCPVFGEIQRETAVARGKMALLEAAISSHGKVDPKLARSLSLCLLCGRCGAICPNEARAHEAIRQARSALALDPGLPLSKRLMSHWIRGERPGKDRLLRGASALQGILTEEIAEDRGLRLRLPIGRLREAWMPGLEPPFFLERVHGRITEDASGEEVQLFVGCAIHYMAPHVGEATVGLLESLGHRVHIPQDQACCGLMAHGMGDGAAARRAALSTLEVFDPTADGPIIVPCASCASHLKHGYPRLLEKGAVKGQKAGERFSARVWELSAFLAHSGLPEMLRARGVEKGRKTVTYHDPCHLVQMGLREEPRALLRALATVEFREMAGADRCCGMGGTFRVSHPRISQRIQKEKISAIVDSSAHAVCTGCMGCWMQLREGVHRAGLDVRVVHLAELLWADLSDNLDRESGLHVHRADSIWGT